MTKPRILTINGGSSSIKFAVFEAGSLQRILAGAIEGIGLLEATLRVKGLDQADNFSRSVTVPDHTVAVGALMDWIEDRVGRDGLTAVGHRVVHGGPKYSKPQRITAEMVEELLQLSAFDPEHLPEEIQLTKAFHRRFPGLPQVACFDTAFHHDLPRVGQDVGDPAPLRRAGGAAGWAVCRKCSLTMTGHLPSSEYRSYGISFLRDQRLNCSKGVSAMNHSRVLWGNQ